MPLIICEHLPWGGKIGEKQILHLEKSNISNKSQTEPNLSKTGGALGMKKRIFLLEIINKRDHLMRNNFFSIQVAMDQTKTRRGGRTPPFDPACLF